jgi:hypothetical protein
MSRVAPAFAALLLALSITSFATPSSAGVYVSVAVAPPILPVYELPPIPGPNYLWTPGYWAYEDDDYYWVPGTWVVAPRVGLLWTPGYWGWGDGYYRWHAGYWGPHIGYYGGICYGHGYFGSGYEGGRWDHGAFFYNTAVVHVNGAVIHNTYNKTIIKNTTITNVSYNGGKGGITAHATAGEIAAEHEHHEGATALQVQHEHTASKDPSLFAKSNHGKPALTATSEAGKFHKASLTPQVPKDPKTTATATTPKVQALTHDTKQAKLTSTGPATTQQFARVPHQGHPQGAKQAAQKAGQPHVQHAPPHVQAHPHPKKDPQHG